MFVSQQQENTEQGCGVGGGGGDGSHVEHVGWLVFFFFVLLLKQTRRLKQRYHMSHDPLTSSKHSFDLAANESNSLQLSAVN